MAVEVDRQQADDDAEKGEPCADGNVEVDELGSIGGSKDCQWSSAFRLSLDRTVEGLAPAGGGRGAGQRAAVMTTCPEGYSPST
jgi:hypothetical protein